MRNVFQLSADDERLSTREKNNSLVTSCCLLTDDEVETFLESFSLISLNDFFKIFTIKGNNLIYFRRT